MNLVNRKYEALSRGLFAFSDCYSFELNQKCVIAELKFVVNISFSENSYVSNYSEAYRYTFNGKEQDAETDLQDYGFRIYNPALGKFLSVDPLTAIYPMLTPYQFASNTPIQAIDLDGLEAANATGATPCHVCVGGTTASIQNQSSSSNPSATTSPASSSNSQLLGNPTLKGVFAGTNVSTPAPANTVKNNSAVQSGSNSNGSIDPSLALVVPVVATTSSTAAGGGYAVVEGVQGIATIGEVGTGATVIEAAATVPLMLLAAVLAPVEMGTAQPQPYVIPKLEEEYAPKITLHRGVSNEAVPTQMYTYAVQGYAVPTAYIPGYYPNGATYITDPNNHTLETGGPYSAFTSWTENINVATHYATNGGTTQGVVLTKTFSLWDPMLVKTNYSVVGPALGWEQEWLYLRPVQADNVNFVGPMP